MNNIPIILLIISIILSLVIYYYINANIIEKFYELTEDDFVNDNDYTDLYDKSNINREKYNSNNNYNNDTLEPRIININRIIDRSNKFKEKINKFKEKINGYGFL